MFFSIFHTVIHRHAGGGVLFFVGISFLLGFDGEITTHIADDSISRHSASCDGGVFSAGKGQVFIRLDSTLLIGRGIFFYISGRIL